MDNIASEIRRVPESRPRPRSAAKSWVRAINATAGLGEHSLTTLPRLIEDMAEKRPNAPALMSPGSTLTYRQLAEATHRTARWALAEGVNVGDIVCLLMRNRPDYLALWLGITQVGGIVALLNPNLAGSALAHCIGLVSPKHLIADASAEALPAGRYKIWRYGAADAPAPGNDPKPGIESEPRIDLAIKAYSGQRLSKTEARRVTLSHKALLIYTSGTTGLPKAAILSHHRIVTWSLWFAGLMDVRPEDRMYDCLPLYHSVGGVVATGALLVSGGSVVIREKFSVKNFWRDVRETEATLFQYIGELCRYLVNEPPGGDEQGHKLRLCCGNGLRPDVWEKFKTRFHIPEVLEFYAATEGNFSLYNLEGRIGAIGRVPAFLAHRFPMTLVAHDPETGAPARDKRGRCVEVGINQPGEAIGGISSDGVSLFGRFEGYTDECATKHKILRNVFSPGDAWFRTGDLMRRDAGGFYYFVDRIGDTFRWKGENVATLEVEETLSTCPGVRDAVVYGVKAPDCEGRAGMAALVVDETFELEAFHRRCRELLPDYARPVFLRLCRVIDVTDTFKHKKNRLVEEGYDPARVNDALFFCDRALQAYAPLDASLFQRLSAGQIRI